MVRALVTGASGYVGSRLVRELHALGEPVGCLVRDPPRASSGSSTSAVSAIVPRPRICVRACESERSCAIRDHR